MFPAFDTPAKGVIADASTKFRNAYPKQTVRVRLIQVCAVNCQPVPERIGLIDTLAISERNVIVERIDPEIQQALSSASYAVPLISGRDRFLDFGDIDVAVFPGSYLRVRFDACGNNEKQWVFINYDFEKSAV